MGPTDGSAVDNNIMAISRIAAAEVATGVAGGWGSYEIVRFRRCQHLSRHYGWGTRGRRGLPRKMTGVPLDLGEADAETSTPPTTSTPVVPTPSLSEGLPAMRMIPTPGSRVQSSETAGARTQTPTPTQTTTHTTTEDDESPLPSQIRCLGPPVDNPLPEGEEEDIALEEELAR
ncbi:hypothetical protein PIB30_074030 [Stylosanthes scabra]|uniref:Uncharacterized protein n=1 Tax=Stylosanthes scabra TaxID=79078 RepID=A0ABU6QRT9_9FABA|nr:hypothetical protein [Stylosanthes scabra]